MAQLQSSDLISRARRGDDAAWEMLVRDHQEAIFRLAYLLLGDAHDAEDVAQDVFVRAFRALNTFDTTRSLRPWLLRITTNLAHNHRRSVGRYMAMVKRAISASPEYSTNLGERTSQQWEAQTLWEAVRRLNTQEQEVVYLRYFLDLSEAEMSAALDVPPGTVKSRLHRAMRRLRSVVDEDFPALREERLV
jgi:RNA polymerase sigma-70 factor, ECF subfamily